MAGNTYVTKGYSTYTDIPYRQGAYDHGPKKTVNEYVVQTTTIERIRTPAAGYTNFGGSPSKIELLKEFVHAPSMSTSPKYEPKGHYEGFEPNHGSGYENSSPTHHRGRDLKKTSNFSGPNKPRASSPVHGYPFEETHRTGNYRASSPVHSYPFEETHRTGNFSSPNKYHPSSPRKEGVQHVRTKNFLGSNNSWQSAGPPVTRHPLTTPTNNINEALSFLEESVTHSPRSDPRRRGGGVLDDLSIREQPIEPQRRYAKPAFVTKTKNKTIDGEEAVRRYNGTFVP